MNIGIIVKTNKSASELSNDWVPEPLGSKQFIYDTLSEILNVSVNSDEYTYDKNNILIYFTIENETNPKAISVSYGSGNNELKILHLICSIIGAKLYDGEASDFI